MDKPVPTDFVGATVVVANDESLVLQHEGHQFQIIPVRQRNKLRETIDGVQVIRPACVLDYVHLGSHS